MTQAELAHASGVGANYVPRLERGEMVPSVEAAWRIARALGVSLDSLCGRASGKVDGASTHEAMLKLQKSDVAALQRVAEAVEAVVVGRRGRGK